MAKTQFDFSELQALSKALDAIEVDFKQSKTAARQIKLAASPNIQDMRARAPRESGKFSAALRSYFPRKDNRGNGKTVLAIAPVTKSGNKVVVMNYYDRGKSEFKNAAYNLKDIFDSGMTGFRDRLQKGVTSNLKQILKEQFNKNKHRGGRP